MSISGERQICDLLIEHASELLACQAYGNGAVRGPDLAKLEVIEDGAVAVTDGRIVAVGTTAQLAARFDARRRIDATGRLVSPGLVDPHTHLVHAGHRETEWEGRVTGRSRPGLERGIMATVRATRAARTAELRSRALADLDTMLAYGTTTAEAKSGYGLDTDTELRLLEITAGLNHPVELAVTYLGAHVLPPEFAADRSAYVDLVIGFLPEARVYAEYCDICCDPVGFTPDECRRIAAVATEYGFRLRVHGDQTGDGDGAALAAEIGAASIDHLDSVSAEGLARLAASDTVGVILPGVTHHMLEATPGLAEDGGTAPALFSDRPSWARRLVDSGAALALSTDYNPGTCATLSMQAVMQLAARLYRLTYAEIWHMATINAAAALNRADRVGSLEPGKQADLVIWDVSTHGLLINRFGTNLAHRVIKKGNIVTRDGA
jgi:imidazolonepropionase